MSDCYCAPRSLRMIAAWLNEIADRGGDSLGFSVSVGGLPRELFDRLPGDEELVRCDCGECDGEPMLEKTAYFCQGDVVFQSPQSEVRS